MTVSTFVGGADTNKHTISRYTKSIGDPVSKRIETLSVAGRSVCMYLFMEGD